MLQMLWMDSRLSPAVDPEVKQLMGQKGRQQINNCNPGRKVTHFKISEKLQEQYIECLHTPCPETELKFYQLSQRCPSQQRIQPGSCIAPLVTSLVSLGTILQYFFDFHDHIIFEDYSPFIKCVLIWDCLMFPHYQILVIHFWLEYYRYCALIIFYWVAHDVYFSIMVVFTIII